MRFELRQQWHVTFLEAGLERELPRGLIRRHDSYSPVLAPAACDRLLRRIWMLSPDKPEEHTSGRQPWEIVSFPKTQADGLAGMITHLRC